MIHSLLDNILPDVSDDEEDEQPEPEFVFRRKGSTGHHVASAVQADGAASAIRSALDEVGDVQPEKCKALVLCGPGAGAAFALSTFPLKPVTWSMEVVNGSLNR